MEDRLVLDPVAARDFAIALLIGALIGIEREKRMAEDGVREVGGIRTFTLFSQIGALSAWFSRELGSPWPVAMAILGVALLLSGAHAVQILRDAREAARDLTTEAAAVVTTLLGATALLGFPELAGALGVLTAALLAFKQPIHGWVGRLDVEDLYAGLKLLIASFIVLPLLPNRPLDPWSALNPYELWLLVILISGLSLVGYVAVRWLGTGRGIVLTGLFGGLASSTAVTLAFARRCKDLRAVAQVDALTAGILLAWALMFVRILTEVAVVHPALLSRVAAPQLAMLTVAAVAAAGFYRASRSAPETAADVPLTNPFRLTSAIKFAGFFALVLLAVALVRTYAPPSGQLLVAGLAGLSDVDAITLSMATLARDGGEAELAARAITIAAFSNTLTKCALAAALGGRSLRTRVGAATIVIVLSGTVALFLV